MRKKMTEAQKRALEIIRDNQPTMYAWRFSKLMWPDSDGHKRHYQCGPKGSTIGLGMAMAAGGYLGRLVKLGLVKRYYNYDSFRNKMGYQAFYILTKEGEEALKQE